VRLRHHETVEIGRIVDRVGTLKKYLRKRRKHKLDGKIRMAKIMCYIISVFIGFIYVIMKRMSLGVG
jgi:hypothetical protein